MGGLNGLEWAHAEWAVTKGHPSERRQINSMAQEAASPGHPTLVRANSDLGTLREDKDTSPLILRRSQSLVGCRSPARVLNISCPRTRAASESAKTGGNARGDMSSQQMVMYRDDFRQYDVDKSGALSPDELKAVLIKQLKRDPSDAEFAAFMKQIDVNEDGKVTLEEYVKWLHGDNWHVDAGPGTAQPNGVPQMLTFMAQIRCGYEPRGTHVENVLMSKMRSSRKPLQSSTNETPS